MADREFVAHLFAPLDGPNAENAWLQLELLWEACRSQLGMTQAVDGADLPTTLPADRTVVPRGVLAGLEDPTGDFQAVLRRESSVLNFSLVMTQPRRPRLGAAMPPGWREFARWWDRLAGGGLNTFLGGATLFLAKGKVDLPAEFPSLADDRDTWWTDSTKAQNFSFWEAGNQPLRRLVVSDATASGERLSRFTWSTGDASLPPLGRYLMYATILHSQDRVLGDGSLITGTLPFLSRSPRRRSATGYLASLAGTRISLHQMTKATSDYEGRMGRIIPEPLPSDKALIVLLKQRLPEYATELQTAERRMREEDRRLAPRTPSIADSVLKPPFEAPQPARIRPAVQRFGFGIDLIENQSGAPQRLAGMMKRVLTGIGVSIHDTDRRDTAAGLIVALPADVQPDLALSKLLTGWREQLDADNSEHPGNRLRLRLSVTFGAEPGRLLDSDVLHHAITEQPGADLAALISDRLYQSVVGAGYPGPVPAEFTPVLVKAKTFDSQAWLWHATRTTRDEDDDQPVRLTEVLVIHDRDDGSREAVFGLLRALGLRPLEWEELVARTGSAAPARGDVLRQAFVDHTAAVVLFAPGSSPDVLAGMALALQPDRTVLARVGDAMMPVELAVREFVHLGGDSVRGHQQLAERLRRLGYAVDTDNTDWLDLERFKGY